MIPLSAFVRTIYAPTFLYGQLSLRTIDAYVESIALYIHFTGDPPIDEIGPANHA